MSFWHRKRSKDSKLPQRASTGKWFDQRDHNGLHYGQVYAELDELTLDGYTPYQIREIIELGRIEYEKQKKG